MDATLLLSAVDATFAARRRPCTPARRPGRVVPGLRPAPCRSVHARATAAAAPAAGQSNAVYTVGDFMTRKENLHVVKPTTSVDEALELLVQHRISGFPVVDDNWKLVSFILNLFPQLSYRFILEYSFCDILLLWNRKRLVHFPLVT